MRKWLPLVALLALNACGDDAPASADATSSHASNTHSNEEAGLAKSVTASAEIDVNTGAASSQSQANGAKSGVKASDAEAKLADYMDTTETQIRACGDNACLHTALRQLSTNMKTVSHQQLSREQQQRLSKRSIAIQRLAAERSK